MRVVFDLDGTLIDSLPDLASAANAVLTARGEPELPDSVVAGFVGMGEGVFVDRLIAATALDLGERPAILADFLRHYKEMASRTRLFDGVTDALANLRARGAALGLCTNKPGGPLDAVLAHLGWEESFDVVVAGDTLPLRKPDPAPLHHAFAALGGPGIYVGDSEVDAATAQAAGVPFVLFTRGIRMTPVEAIPHDVAFEDFAALPEICERLTKAKGAR
jgi:phosphoglycolate phosphatase